MGSEQRGGGQEWRREGVTNSITNGTRKFQEVPTELLQSRAISRNLAVVENLNGTPGSGTRIQLPIRKCWWKLLERCELEHAVRRV